MRSLVIVLVGLLLVAAPVAAHGNSLAADTQTSTDGTVVVEVLTHVSDGFLVLHADDGGQPGSVVGHTDPGEGPFGTDVEVTVDPAYWANVTGSVTVWAAFHRDEGESGFDPDTDPIQIDASGDRVAERIAVGKRDGNRTLVLAESPHERTVNTSRVTVRRVELAEPGYLTVRADDDGTPGRIVGTRELAAGAHRDVAVDIDDAFYHDRDKRFSLWAVVHRSDGDGSFEQASDGPVTVDGMPIGSRFDLRRTDDTHEHEHEHGAGTGTSPGTTTHSPTSTPTPTAGSSSSPVPGAATDSPTPSATPSDRVASPASPVPGTTTEPTPRTTAGQGPGFGAIAAVAVVAAVTLIVLSARRRKRR